MIRRMALALLLIALACCGCGQTEKEAEPLKAQALLLDTICTVTLYAPADQALLDEVMAEIPRLEGLLSRTVEGSDIWRINHAGGRPMEVAPETAELIRLGLEYGELSNGLFDISIGRLTALWDFGGEPAVPDADELAAALATVDYRQVGVDGNIVTVADADAWLDLGGIAKGYIADRLAALLREAGAAAVIDLGGNVLTVGQKPGNEPWLIGVDQPFSDRSSLIGAISVAEASVVSSGVYERYFIQDGQMYHHILDPRSGYPADSDLLGATIISQSSAVGDALSTVCLLAGMEQGSALLDGLEGVSGALWVDADENIFTQGDIDFIQ